MFGKLSTEGLSLWLVSYKLGHRDLLDRDPEFAAWLEKEYVPVAGAWHY